MAWHTTVFNATFFFIYQVFVNDTKVFGDYKCVASNLLGSLDHQIVMKEGTKPDPPAKVSLFVIYLMRLVVVLSLALKGKQAASTKYNKKRKPQIPAFSERRKSI